MLRLFAMFSVADVGSRPNAEPAPLFSMALVLTRSTPKDLLRVPCLDDYGYLRSFFGVLADDPNQSVTPCL